MICPPPETRRIFCLCGCGNPTKIIDVNRPSRGQIKGQFREYCKGHWIRTNKRTPEQIAKGVRSGSDHWNYGGTANETTRAKISAAVRNSAAGKRGSDHWRYGRKLSEETRAKMAESQRKRHADQPRGYNGPENQRDRGSPKHIAWRSSVYERDKYTCQECGQVGGKLHAHHIQPWATYPDLRYELTNGVTLCAEKCHRKASGWKGYV